jgi:hypothetical protein
MEPTVERSRYRKLAICPDHGFSPYLWNREGGGVVADAEFFCGSEPMSRGLWEDFAAWMRRFSHAAYQPGGFPPEWDWPAFHGEGIDLAHRLKAEIGPDCELTYEAPPEDPTSFLDAPITIEMVSRLAPR